MLWVGNIFYLLVNGFRIYVVCRFFDIFFEHTTKKSGVKFLWIGYYLLNSLEYLLINEDNFNLLINIIALLVIGIFGYEENCKKKILAIVLNMGVGVLAENIAWVVFVKGKEVQMEDYGNFFSVFMFFALELFIEKTVRLRKRIEISLYKSILLVLIPMGSMFIANILIEGRYQSVSHLVIALVILLIINISIFYLYERILDDCINLKNKEIYELQLKMYQKQLEIMQSENDTYRIMRHDTKHHSILLADYIKRNENALQYLEKMNHYIGGDKQYIETGNKSIDSILNYVIEEVNKIQGTIETDIKIAEALEIDDFDINIILSNLLMNACEAIRQSEEKRIAVAMRYDRGILKINIRNTYNGTIKVKKGEIISIKENEGNHGIGLISVKKTVEKYGGAIKIDYDEKEFKVDIFLYIR